MKLYKNLYIGETAAEDRRKIIKDLKAKKLRFGVFVVCLSASKRDLLDIIPSFMLYKDSFDSMEILGIAQGKEEAFEVCRNIVMDVYEKTGDFDVRGFFS